MLVARGVPAGLLYWGGGALRVRQIGRKLHTEPYGPEQKCTNSAALGPARSPPQMSASGGEASSWRGIVFLYTQNLKDQRHRKQKEESIKQMIC